MEFGKTSLTILNFFHVKISNLKWLYKIKKIITAIGFAHQEFARKVILSLGLSDYTDNYFKEQNEYAEEDLIFTLSDEEFDEVKRSIENSL